MTKLSQNFSRPEFLCKGENCHPSGTGNCGFDTVDTELLRLLENVRNYFKKSVHITSGCRCPTHNEAVGGSHNSQHKLGRAADIIVADTEPDDVADFLDKIMITGAIGRYKTFTHVDTRTNDYVAGWSGNY